ncbi:MAG: hypothetical protein M3N98_10450 [Actinomycetota bacterium]|nr:hypothetical protein [Actinomycetota bacterium]
MKYRFLRVGDHIDDDASLVVRGGDLDPVALRSDALRNHQIYGTYGISVFAVRETTLDEMAQLPPLVPFERLILITAGVLRAADLRLEPTGRNRRHFDVAFDNLDAGIARLCACEHEIFVNPYHE